MSHLTLLETQSDHDGPMYTGANVLAVPAQVALEFNHPRFSAVCIDPLEVIDTALNQASSVPGSNLRTWQNSKVAWVISPQEIDLYSYDGIKRHVERSQRRLTFCDVGISSLAYYLWQQKQKRFTPLGNNVIDLNSYKRE